MNPTQAQREALTAKLKSKLSASQQARIKAGVLASIESIKMSKYEKQFNLYLKTIGADLPPHEREYRFHPSRRWRFDFAWPAVKVAVECDGGQWLARGGRHARDADREKLNAAACLGWRVLRYSGKMLEKPDAVIGQVRQALSVGKSDHAKT